MASSDEQKFRMTGDELSTASYEDLVADAVRARFIGWDFSYLNGRVRESDLPWSYVDLARSNVSEASRVLDLNTGGGELLIEILEDRSPVKVAATEGWAPNLPVARRHLEPRGIQVRESQRTQRLPADDGEFTLILNRHGASHPAELRRVLCPDGVYLTQGVGRLNDIGLNVALEGPPPGYRDTATRAHDVERLERHGFSVIDSLEAFVEYGFLDIGAVVYHLRAVSWQVPGLDVLRYDTALRRIDAQIRETGEFTVRHHRYLIHAARG